VIAASADGSGSKRVLPGTLTATSVSAGESADVIYYTLGGDSRIHRQELSSGITSVVHDFGAPVVVRGVDYAAGRLVAMIDGQFAVDSTASGTAQTLESGGTLVVVVPGGPVTPIATSVPMWFRRPALSADGAEIVAEGETLLINPIRDGAGTIVGYDTIPGHPALWRIAVQ
jgi:hypothetical protein